MNIHKYKSVLRHKLIKFDSMGYLYDTKHNTSVVLNMMQSIVRLW